MNVGKMNGVRYHDTIVKVRQTALQFVKFCIVGGSGVVVDMSVLCLLADPRYLGLPLVLGKACAAEAAMTNNFLWNEVWTFRQPHGTPGRQSARWRRFFLFNAICGMGIVLAIALLEVFHRWLGWNLYVANLVAIILVTFWNFGINARFNWGLPKREDFHPGN